MYLSRTFIRTYTSNLGQKPQRSRLQNTVSLDHVRFPYTNIHISNSSAMQRQEMTNEIETMELV